MGLCTCGNKACVGFFMALLCYLWPCRLYMAVWGCTGLLGQCRLVHGYAGLCGAALDYDQRFTSKKTWSSSCS